MKRHALVLAGVSVVVLSAALASPGHALMLALGLAAGPAIVRTLAAGAGARPFTQIAAAPAAGGDGDILDAIALPVIVLDRRINVLHANPAAVAAFPTLAREAPLSFALRDPTVLEAVGASIAEARPRAVELIERVPVERSFVVAVSPVADASGRGARPVAVLILRETSKERAIETIRVDFVANASHELRTPLASVLGFIETLQGPARDDPAARERFLTIMHQQASRMARLVDDLLSLSRIELKEHIAPTETIDIGAIADQAALTLSELARERQVAIEVIRHTDDCAITGDRDELASVLDNLIENAIKYGHSGGRVEVGIAQAPGGRDIAVAVRDFGPGIAPQHLPRLTERFYRVDSALSRAEGGTGLGLALVKHTINRHRGRLTVESEPGRGATFTITLPRAGKRDAPVINP